MGRTVVGDGSAEDDLREWVSSGVDNFGLAVGQLSSSSSDDQIAFLAPTLPPQEDKVELEEDDDEDANSEDGSSSSDAAPRKEPPAPPIVLGELTPSWLTHHSQQLSRLLTGGLDIVGIFVVCSPESLQEMTKSGKLKSFFTALEKQAARRFGGVFKGLPQQQEKLSPPHAERYLLHGCSKTKAISCLSVDVADGAYGCNMKPATVKFQEGLFRSWSRIDCRIGLNCVIDIPASKLSKCSLMKQIQQGLAPTLKELMTARIVLTRAKEDAKEEEETAARKLPSSSSCLIDVGRKPEPENIAPSSSSSSKSSRKGGGRKGQGDAGKKSAPPPPQEGGHFNASVFKMIGNRNDDSSLPSSTSSLDCATQMILRGTICSRAHLHAKASVEESVAALKRDMIHSILARVELLCDSMLTEEDQETLPTAAVLYEMPVRIFAPIGSERKTISIADFMFRDEKKQDAVVMIKEVTGKDVAEDCLEVSAESFMPNQLSAASSIDSLASHQSGNDQDANPSRKYSKHHPNHKRKDFIQVVKDFLSQNGVIIACVFGASASLYSAYLHIDQALF